MNGAEVLAQHDPGFLKAQRRQRWWIVGLTVLAIAALVGAALAIVGTIKTETRVTKLQPRVTRIERSPCTKDPTGAVCQALRAEVEEHADQRVTCIPFHKAGYPCPRPGFHFQTDPASDSNGPSVPDQSQGGDASQQPSNHGHQQPGPHDGGSPASPGKESPAADQAAGAKQSPSEASPAPSPSPGTPEGKPPVQAAGEAVAKTAEAATGALEETAEAVHDAGCQLTHRC
ncbi:MAG TPA: hypothetical protein VF009_11365 [Solirubrobacterales bacterium]